MNIQLITKDIHANKYWQKFTNYHFTENERVAPLTLAELAKAQQSLPIAFIKQANNYQPVALLGLTEGNAFVNAQGNWFQSAYIPAVFRAYPFRLGKNEAGQLLLCIDEDSGLVTDSPGEAFFDAQGNPSEKIQSVLNLLVQVEHNQEPTQMAMNALAEQGLISTWPLTLQAEDGEKRIEGLYRIDETALNALTGEALVQLIQTGGLGVAYAQLFSMQNMQTLTDLIRGHTQAKVQQAALPVSPSTSLDLDYLNEMGGLDFSHYK